MTTTHNKTYLNKNLAPSKTFKGNKLQTYKSNGKLLLTGEYVVLDGAKALAIPTKYGQQLNVEINSTNTITWKSYDELGTIWFEDEFILKKTKILKKTQTSNAVSIRLIEILNAAKALNQEFLNPDKGYTITTQQNFNRHWGLGTSSTLINNIANWANIDAYTLLEKTFGGSGYDIACAQYNTPITFQLTTNKTPNIKAVNFNPSYKDHLYFVYLNQKQNSRTSLANYRKARKIDPKIIDAINEITDGIITSKTRLEFNTLLSEHETIIAKLTKQNTIQSQYFSDFNGVVKSLGAWGGDFVLVSSERNPTSYFTAKGFNTVIPFKAMVL